GLLEGVELAGADGVVDDADDPVVLVGQVGQGLDVGVAAVEAGLVGDAHGRVPPSSSMACRSSASSGTLWCQATLLLMYEMGCPLWVCAMTKVGLPGRNGTADSTSSSSPWSWPLTSTTAKPNAAALASSGSRSLVSRVVAPCWSRLRSTMTVSRSSSYWEAAIMASQLLPSWSSPSPVST